jgi:hypothetical protein
MTEMQKICNTQVDDERKGSGVVERGFGLETEFLNKK